MGTGNRQCIFPVAQTYRLFWEKSKKWNSPDYLDNSILKKSNIKTESCFCLFPRVSWITLKCSKSNQPQLFASLKRERKVKSQKWKTTTRSYPFGFDLFRYACNQRRVCLILWEFHTSNDVATLPSRPNLLKCISFHSGLITGRHLKFFPKWLLAMVFKFCFVWKISSLCSCSVWSISRRLKKKTHPNYLMFWFLGLCLGFCMYIHIRLFSFSREGLFSPRDENSAAPEAT